MLAMPASAPAKPLEYDNCQELKTEQRTLRNAGVERNMRRGPDWAKANLTDEDLGQVRRYLTVEELIRFRCGIKRKPKTQQAKSVVVTRNEAPDTIVLGCYIAQTHGIDYIVSIYSVLR